MAFKFNRSSKEPMSEINVTPFVDVMLVLLIIFMVTAPLLTVGVQVDLPEVLQILFLKKPNLLLYQLILKERFLYKSLKLNMKKS
jgi:biopolymer transport protein ExbD